MSSVFLFLTVLAPLAFLALAHAVSQAEAGYEDEKGYHPAEARRRRVSRSRVQRTRDRVSRWSTVFRSTETPVGMFGPL